MIIAVMFTFFAAFSCVGIHAEIISTDRRIEWTPGIPGGIPENSVTVSVADYGAAADGATNDYNAFAQAIAALPSGGGVVLVPEGTYLIASTILLDDGVVLRGEGADKTRLHFAMSDATSCIEAVTYERGAWVDVISGYEKGSAQIAVTDGSLFGAGQFIEIQQDNDADLMYTDARWIVDWAQYSVGQIAIIESVSGNTLTLDKPLYLTYRAGLNPQARTQGFVEYAGVEKLFITRTNPDADGYTFSFKNAAYCWVREVESDHTRKCHIAVHTAYRCEFRHNYLHHSYDYGGGGHGYGVDLGRHTTDCLVEDNIFRHLRHSMLVQVGASGNVFGYNYSLENVQGTGESNLNVGWTPCDISLHGHYPNYNLFESNVVQEIDVADYWGPCGPGNTFLRNITQSEGIEVFDYSHGQNIIGNMPGSILTVENGVENTLIHGNTVNGTLSWDPEITDRDIPVSYYLENKPSFLGDTPWPLFGPDCAAGEKLPAQERYESGEYTGNRHSLRQPITTDDKTSLATRITTRRLVDISGRIIAENIRGTIYDNRQGIAQGLYLEFTGVSLQQRRLPGH